MASTGSLAPGEFGLCRYFLRGWDCEGRCNGLHTPRAERPSCPRWLRGAAHGGCPHAPADCFFPHSLPLNQRVLRNGVRCAVQVRATHATRSVDFLREQFSTPGGRNANDKGEHSSGAVEVFEARAHGSTLKSDRLLMLSFAADSTFDVHEWLRELHPKYSFLAPALVRCFMADAVVDSETDAVAFYVKALADRSTKPKGVETTRVRVHAFPKTLESSLAEELHSSLASSNVVITKTTCSVVLSAVYVDGYFYCALESAEKSPCLAWGKQLAVKANPPLPQPLAMAVRMSEIKAGEDALPPGTAATNPGTAANAAPSPPKQPSSPAVGRAEHKLREVATRTNIFADLMKKEEPLQQKRQRRVAIDVGAAPGGWTQCLLDDLGFDQVYAVDPADVPMAVGRGPDAVDHMRCLGSAAIANLLAAPERVQLAAFVQDANVPTAVALNDLEAAKPLLQKGCAVVITLKNFDGNFSKWVLARAAAEERLKLTCDSVQQLHLFRNGPVETTLVGVVR